MIYREFSLKSGLGFAIIFFLFAYDSLAQETIPPSSKRNFSHSPNPKKRVETAGEPGTETAKQNSSVMQNEVAAPTSTPNETSNSTTSAASTASKESNKDFPDVRFSAATTSLSPTEIYRVGVGDVLLVALQNSPTKDSSYFTVLKDGTIDFPLAGKMLAVSGLTVEDIEELLAQNISIVENPRVSVKVREYNSHTYKVLGLVERPGEKFLQREAIPLYVVRAEAIAQPKASRVLIKRASLQIETIDLLNQKYEDIFVYPGDIVEFAQADTSDDAASGYVYISGNVVAGGQKLFHKGLTLTQAIFSARGVTKAQVRRVVVRRRNNNGLLETQVYDLKAILDGKVADPLLQSGDTIEVGN